MKTLRISNTKKVRCLLLMMLALMLLLTMALPCLAEENAASANNSGTQIVGDNGTPNTVIGKNGEEISTIPDPLLVAANQTPIKPEKWGWLIGIYLFLGGLGAGAYLTSFLTEKRFFSGSGALKKAGYYIGAPAVAIGALLLVFDLGQGLHKPWLILRMFLNFSSVMTWGIYILSLFIVVGLIKAFLAWRNLKSPSVLSWLGAVLAVCTMVYTGLLLYAAKAIPFWESPLIPFLFVVSALSTGLSATLLFAHLLDRRQAKAIEKAKLKSEPQAEAISEPVAVSITIAQPITEHKVADRKMSLTHLVLVVLEIIAFLALIIPAFTGLNGEAAALSAKAIISGSLAVYFWLLFVCLGLLLPAAIYLIQLLKRRRETPLSTGMRVVTLVCDSAVLVGGLTLRCLIVFAAYPIWNGLLR